MPLDVELVAEPTNPYDSNAIRASVHGRQVGYVSAAIAGEVCAAFAEAGVQRAVVPGVARGGSTERHNIGIHIWIARGDPRSRSRTAVVA